MGEKWKRGMSMVLAVLLVAVVLLQCNTTMTKAATEEESEFENLTVLATYNFESDFESMGLSDAGYGKAPSIVYDSEKGNVLQFADGEASEYLSGGAEENADVVASKNSTNIVFNTPSALQLDTNPFVGIDGSKGATISFWVKISEYPSVGNVYDNLGILGFISTWYEGIEHPDKVQGLNETDEIISGYYCYGIALNPFDSVTNINSMLYFGGFLANNMWYFDNYQTFLLDQYTNTWVFMTVTLGNNIDDNKVYINGQDLSHWNSADGGKRFNKGENNGNSYNATEPYMMDILTAETTTAYLGLTGFTGTSSCVYIDDVTYYAGIASADDVEQLYANEQSNIANGVKYGDVNSDGSVDVTDALLVLRYYVKLISFDDDQLAIADVDGSNSVDVTDALLVLQCYVKLIDIFPIDE